MFGKQVAYSHNKLRRQSPVPLFSHLVNQKVFFYEVITFKIDRDTHENDMTYENESTRDTTPMKESL